MKKFIIYLFGSIAVIEMVGALLSAFNLEPSGYKQRFGAEWMDPVNPYADRDTVVGVWHEPNDSWHQIGPCYSVPMQSNRFGARDNQWDTTKPGNFFVGSSFIEGFGMHHEKRFSEVFEKLTNKEVFNCGMGGECGPLQYFLTTKKFASILNFDTCFVFLFLPKDDRFTHVPDPSRYRPYLTDTGIAYTRSTEDMPLEKTSYTKAQLLLLQYSYTYHLLIYFKNRNFLKSETLEKREEMAPKQYTYIDKVIGMYAEEFPDKQLYFIIFPSLEYEPGELCTREDKNIKIIDLTSVLNKRSDYLDCNLHWNASGHDKVARALYESVYNTQ